MLDAWQKPRIHKFKPKFKLKFSLAEVYAGELRHEVGPGHGERCFFSPHSVLRSEVKTSEEEGRKRKLVKSRVKIGVRARVRARVRSKEV